MLFVFASSSYVATAASPNALLPEEKESGFKLLFNGKELSGWEHSGNWKVVDGEITRNGSGGSLVYQTAEVPDRFELRFEWKVAPGSNSGVYYRPTQYEYQILDNSQHVDGRNPRTSAASLYFCMAPSHDATTTPGEWNTGRVVCAGTVIQHWLNGKKVVDFDYANPMWKDNVTLLKLRGGDLAARGAHLNLQDHGDPVWYRFIRMRTIPDGEQLVSENIKPQELTLEQQAAEKKKLDGIVERRERQAEKRQQQ
jgi:hypothetical protein